MWKFHQRSMETTSLKDDKLQKSKSIDDKINILMFVCTTVLWKYMKLLRNYVHNLSDNTHVRSKLYRVFYHCIVYIANDRSHVKISNIHGSITSHKSWVMVWTQTNVRSQQNNQSLPTILARGVTFNLLAASAVINTKAAAPSFNVLALAAVTVPSK